MSASARTMFGDLPPSSSVTRLSARPAVAPISRPTAVEPVKAILSTPGCSTSAAPVAPSPVTTLTTPSGIPASSAELAEPQGGQRRLLGGLEDHRAAGRQRRAELPARHQQREVPRDDLAADADRLLARVGEDARVARPGSTSPVDLASASPRSSAGDRPSSRRRRSSRALTGLPLSSDSSWASSSAFSSTRSARALMQCRPLGGATASPTPASNAARAALTARSTSSAPPWATSAIVSPGRDPRSSNVLPVRRGDSLAPDQHVLRNPTRGSRGWRRRRVGKGGGGGVTKWLLFR